MRYDFPKFTLDYNKREVLITFDDGAKCSVSTNKDHSYHAGILSINEDEFNLLHELCHQMVGFAYGNDYCPIVWASAHGLEMPSNSDELEHQITALSYFTLEHPMRHAHEWFALGELSKKSDVWDLKKRVSFMFKRRNNEVDC